MQCRWWSAALLAAVAMCTASCADVTPWQRGTLAKPQMALVPNPVRSAQRAHTFAAREAAPGSSAQQGGGCGCN